jgi:hypothetical protein
MVYGAPYHAHTDFVTIGEAARACGVPYQYIFGLAKRSLRSGKPHMIKVCEVYDSRRDKHIIEVCKQCCIDKYGEAQPTTPGGDVLATPLIGYRTWNINYAGTELTSCAYDLAFVWKKDGSEAKCSKRSPACLMPRHTCGMYALNDPEPTYDGDVFGACELWGRYTKGENGTRAQYGKPIGLLCANYHTADKVHRVAGIYEIPVVHNLEALKEVSTDEYRQGDVDWRSYAADAVEDGGGADRAGSGDGTAACRIAAARASSLDELKFLVREGVISKSNVLELFWR